MAGIIPRASTEGTSVDSQASKVAVIIICNTFILVVSTLAVAIRVFVRLRYITFGLDDLFCVIGWAFTTVECIVCILMTNYGYGKHIDTIQNVNETNSFLKLDFVTELAYIIALCCIKVSFGLFYLRIFPGKWFRIVCWAVMAVLSGDGVAEVFVVIFQCSPVYKAWDASGNVGGKCLQLLSFFYITFAIRLATDIALLILPIPKLVKLKVTGGKRAGLIVMLGLGALVTVTGIIRVTYLVNFSIDHTWSLVEPLNWSSVELGVGLFTSCVPSFKALVTLRFPKLRSLLGLSNDRSYPGRYEMYANGTASRRPTGPDDPRSWRRSHQEGTVQSKLANTRTQTEIGASRNGSEERIISDSPEGIQVTTDVMVDHDEHRPSGSSQWPLIR